MKKNLLELFSGTGSVGKVAKDNYNVISLDRDMNADIKEDIMTWDYKKYPKDYFYIITASPVCLWWSRLRNCWIGRKCKTIHPTEIITKDHIMEDINKYGKPMVDKIFEIINYFNPAYWWIENPTSGKMKNYISEKYPEYDNYYDVDYCKYSNWGYKKKTRFWTNIKDFNPKICKNDCENMVLVNIQKLHKKRLGCHKTVLDNGKIIRVNTKELIEKYRDFDNIQLQHKVVLGNGYEMINGVKTVCNTKELRNKYKNKKDKGISFNSKTTLEQRYRIPELLIKDLLEKCII